MNEQDYGSLEACQRLLDAGIVVETENYWYHHLGGEWKLYPKEDVFGILKSEHLIPALSMAEAWRELPDSYGPSTTLLLEKHYNEAIAGYFDWDEEDFTKAKFRNINPTDALIDLLIWTRKEGKDGNT